ncbi:hypothetical protein PFISCL1PPCAC_10368, partial [Pristionchus fissidentatus]
STPSLRGWMSVESSLRMGISDLRDRHGSIDVAYSSLPGYGNVWEGGSSPPPPPLPTQPPPPLEVNGNVRVRLTPSPKSVSSEDSIESRKGVDESRHSSQHITYHRPLRLNGSILVMDSPLSSSSHLLLPSPSSLLSSPQLPLPSYDQATKITMRKSSEGSTPRFSRSTIRQASFKAAINNQLSSSSSSTPSCVSPTAGLLPPFSHSFSTTIPANNDNIPDSIDPSPSSSFVSSSSSSNNRLNSIPPSSSESTTIPIENGGSMRRARPKSYVLATSCSFPVGGPSSPPPTITNARGSSSALVDIDSASSSREESKGEGREGREGGKEREINSNPTHLPPLQGGEDHSKTQRLHRIFALFSHNNENHKTSPSRDEKKEEKKERRKRSRTTVVTNRIPLPSSRTPVSIRCEETVKQGALLHQELALGVSLDSKRLTRLSQWNQCWAVLTANKLYLCRQLSSYHSDLTGERMLSIPSEAQVLNLEGALADIAYEYSRVREEQRFIVRVVTQERSEHLLQCAKEAEMLEWINRIQEAAASSSNHNSIQSDPRSSSSSVISPSSPPPKDGEGRTANQLIMHRYKAKSTALGSPISTKKTNQEGVGTSSGGNMKTETNGEATSSGGTPKTVRRWKRGKEKEKDKNKHLSMLEPGPSNVTPGAFALGTRLGSCPTRGDDDLVPLIVRTCAEVIERIGMDSVGIFRIPGNTAAVVALERWIAVGGPEVCNPSDARWKDVNVVSSLLKQFLRRLPEPLLTDKLYPFFIDANRMIVHPQRVHKIRNLLRKLPRAHYECLKFIITHLYNVSEHAEVNRMDLRNVSLMFGPSIVRPSDDSMGTMVSHMSDQCRIVETFLNYREWMFKDDGTLDDAVPPEHPADVEARLAQTTKAAGTDGPPPGVSTASFNDMHSMIIRANEKQAEDMMKENDKGKIKNILNVRRSSKRDKSKSKKGVSEPMPSTSQAPPPSYPAPMRNLQSTRTETSVDSSFSGNYQERDIDAEIASRSKCSSSGESTRMGSADRKEDEEGDDVEVTSIKEEFSQLSMQSNESVRVNTEDRKKHQESLSSARRIFIAGSEAAAMDSLSSSHSQTSATMDALTNHTQHLHQAASPALEVYSAETREKIRRMQLLGTNAWRNVDKPCSPSREDAISYTSDYSTTSSLAPSQSIGVVVASFDGLGPTSSDYASSDPSPCGRRTREEKEENGRLSRPDNLRIGVRSEREEERRGRRHTLSGSEEDQSVVESMGKWRMSRGKSYPSIDNRIVSPPLPPCQPPAIIRTSPNEMTPASGDEQL